MTKQYCTVFEGAESVAAATETAAALLGAFKCSAISLRHVSLEFIFSLSSGYETTEP